MPVLVLAVAGLFACRAHADIIISRSFDRPIPSPGEPNAPLGQGKMVDAFIDVEQHVSIVDLNIAVSLNHSSFLDLQIMIESPEGTEIMLNPYENYAFITRGPDGRFMPVGGSNRFLFDDEAPLGIEQAVPPFDQAFRPASDFKLSVFDGQDVFGQWRLRIYDAFISNSGRLEAVELIITTPEPTTAVLFCLGASLVSLLKPRRRTSLSS